MTTGKIDSYCNQKFWWLNVDLTRKQQYSCCSATPSYIDTEWLSKNPGRLFNTPLLHQERQAMLNGEPVASCWDNCFKPESRGIVSRRQLENGTEKTHTSIEASPTMINIVLGSTCNLTCVYCCKQYSSAWLQDIEKNGTYFENNNRFKIFDTDKLKKHFEIESDSDYTLLVNEINSLDVESVYISGGEPFLYNHLSELITKTPAKQIKINTGLGVDPVRFQNQIDQIKHIEHVEILISAESGHDLYELVRYGNSYNRFLENLAIVQQSGLKYAFVSVISNITVLGIFDFWSEFKHCEFNFLLCNDPDFLSVNVLDEHSKQQAKLQIEMLQHPIKSTILENIDKPVLPDQRKNFGVYIKEFTKRKNLSLDCLPNSLTAWIEHA